jgi:hypothetical protein
VASQLRPRDGRRIVSELVYEKVVKPLLDELEAKGKLIADLERYRTAFNEWHDKTEWVQSDKRFCIIKPWGKHRADVLKEYIERLEAQITDTTAQLANAESKCRELAAELSAVDKIHDEAVFITDDHYEQCPPEVQKIIRSLAVLQIPDCDAFLAEVRASGADEVSAICRGLANKDGCSVNMRCSYNLTAERAEAIAAQLRKGAAL